MESGEQTSIGTESAIREAPTTFKGILKELGPGLIIAGSVVGSGELIATTVAGAEAGFFLLWVILIGCFIKVFVQLEIGKATILTGRTTLDNLGHLPGWKPRGLHWIAWCVVLLSLGTIGQMGGVVGGVGQALTISVPLSEQGRTYNAYSDAKVRAELAEVEQISSVEPAVVPSDAPPTGIDIYVWSCLLAVMTALILYFGRYALIEKVVMILVVGFTLVTMLNLLLLQANGTWAISMSEFLQGFKFQLPPKQEGLYPIATALAAFGIIGMAAGELIYYPYWCLEKGYARHVGKRDASDSWEIRAKGWIRVMQWDAWGSMAIYTVSTVGFYLLGAAILGRAGLHPQGMDMIRTLAAMYEPVFGKHAVGLFLFGSVIVLYSTFFVNNASSAYVWSDIVSLLFKNNSRTISRQTVRRIFCVALPLSAFVMFVLIPKPKGWIIFAGMMQTLMLPLLGYAAIHFRLIPTASRFRSSRMGDIMIFISAGALFIAGTWLLLTLLFPTIRELG